MLMLVDVETYLLSSEEQKLRILAWLEDVGFTPREVFELEPQEGAVIVRTFALDAEGKYFLTDGEIARSETVVPVNEQPEWVLAYLEGVT